MKKKAIAVLIIVGLITSATILFAQAKPVEAPWDRVWNEISQIWDAVTDLDDRVTTEVSTLDGKIDGLDARVTSEVSRLDGEIGGLDASVTSEVSRLDGKIDGLDDSVTSEVSRLDGEIAGLNDRVTSEVSRLDGKIDGLDDRVTSEVSRLDGEIAGLNDRVTSEVSRLDGEIAGLNDRVTSEVSELELRIDNAGVPVGAIMMWNGDTDTVPDNWHICDGTEGTPDLQDRFIVGSGSSYTIGATGGAATVTLNVSQMPSHSHQYSGTTSTDGEHSHVSFFKYNTGEVIVGLGLFLGADNHLVWDERDTSLAGKHSHTYSGDTNDVGGGAAHENCPPYYALAYIMKVA